MRTVVILLTMFTIAFMLLTFYPTRFDPTQVVYMQHNKANTIYETLFAETGALQKVEQLNQEPTQQTPGTPSSSQTAYTEYKYMIINASAQVVNDTFASAGRPGHGALDLDRTGLNHTPIGAAYDGVVYKSGWLVGGGGYGNSVIIKHNINGEVMYTKYNHLWSVSVSEGDTVKAGQEIGLCGGTSNKPNKDDFAQHLDFQMYTEYTGDPNMNLVNPSSLLLGRVDKISDCTVFKRTNNNAAHTVLKEGKDLAYATKLLRTYSGQPWAEHDAAYN